MAQQDQMHTTRTTRSAKRAVNGSKASARRRRSVRRTASRNLEISEIERMIRDLEDRIAGLTNPQNIHSTVAGATNQVGRAVTQVSNHAGNMAADMLTDVADRLRGSANSVTGVAKVGTQALQKVGSELERRPFMTVAIALGIGFLAGLAGRRNEQAQ